MTDEMPKTIWAGIDRLEMYPQVWEKREQEDEDFVRYTRTDLLEPYIKKLKANPAVSDIGEEMEKEFLG